MAEHGGKYPSCQSCGKIFPVMKRCVQCQQVFYCSRSCQVDDWKCHKSLCLKRVLSQDQSAKSVYARSDDKCIFTDDSNEPTIKSQCCLDKSQTDNQSQCQTCDDFQTAFDKLNNSKNTTTENPQKSALSYLHNNDYYTDVPLIDTEKPYCKIIVKSNKEKITMQIQDGWTGEEIVKVLACHLKIPFEDMKIIHKGKFVTTETMRECTRPKALFQVLGVKAADEAGLEKGDVDILMSQLHLDRRQAVMALQKNGTLVDAIIEAGNK